MTVSLEDPLDLVKLSLDQQVEVQMKGDRQVRGRLQVIKLHCILIGVSV